MTEFIRVRDKNTGHEYTINAALADDKTTFNSAYERLTEVDAVDLNGTPLPPVYADPAIDETPEVVEETPKTPTPATVKTAATKEK